MTETKIVSGFCEAGAHQGQKKISPSGKVFPQCKGLFISPQTIYPDWTCTCWCHELYSKTVAMMEAEGINLPATVPQDAVVGSLHTARYDDTGEQKQSVSGDPTAPNIGPKLPPIFAPTQSGRKARGELEASVLEACEKWDKLGGVGTLTPSMIAEIIDTHSPPSTGAVTAVLERWADIGFGTMGRKPIRFSGFTEEGRKLGLWTMKDQNKAHKRRTKSAIRRGF